MIIIIIAVVCVHVEIEMILSIFLSFSLFEADFHVKLSKCETETKANTIRMQSERNKNTESVKKHTIRFRSFGFDFKKFTNSM